MRGNRIMEIYSTFDEIAQVNYSHITRSNALRKETESNTKTIPISTQTLILAIFNILAICCTSYSLIYNVLILTIPSGVAIAFAIVFDSLAVWDRISNKFRIKFKD